ncbi:MAG TPA: tetratricopeptide repeat protein [Streptosporangiaceae bacterium]|jgi:tetratricopeptide (TPR) repeat protein
MKGYFRTVAQLSKEAFDAIEFDAARTDDHRAAAQQMSRLAAASEGSGAMPRAEAYLRAGEQWLLADDAAAAAGDFQRALDEGSPAFVEARVALARALYLLGRADEAAALVAQLEAEGRKDPRLCDLVAELLVEQSDFIGALDWANSGVELCLPMDQSLGQPLAVPPQLPPEVDRTELRLLLSLRYRIRNDIGLPEDGYDKLLDEI